MVEAGPEQEGPDPGGGVEKEKVTWKLLDGGKAEVRLRSGIVFVVRSTDANIVDNLIECDIDEKSMGSFFRYCQELCTSSDEDRKMLAWMCKVVEMEDNPETKDWRMLGLRSTWSILPPQWSVEREAAGDVKPQQDLQSECVVKEGEVKLREVVVKEVAEVKDSEVVSEVGKGDMEDILKIEKRMASVLGCGWKSEAGDVGTESLSPAQLKMEVVKVKEGGEEEEVEAVWVNCKSETESPSPLSPKWGTTLPPSIGSINASGCFWRPWGVEEVQVDEKSDPLLGKKWGNQGRKSPSAAARSGTR